MWVELERSAPPVGLMGELNAFDEHAWHELRMAYNIRLVIVYCWPWRSFMWKSAGIVTLGDKREPNNLTVSQNGAA